MANPQHYQLTILLINDRYSLTSLYYIDKFDLIQKVHNFHCGLDYITSSLNIEDLPVSRSLDLYSLSG